MEERGSIYFRFIESFIQPICSKGLIHSLTPLCDAQTQNTSVVAFFVTIFVGVIMQKQAILCLKYKLLNINLLFVQLQYNINITFAIMLIFGKKRALCEILLIYLARYKYKNTKTRRGCISLSRNHNYKLHPSKCLTTHHPTKPTFKEVVVSTLTSSLRPLTWHGCPKTSYGSLAKQLRSVNL